MEFPITIAEERPDQPDVMALLAALDRYLGGLYEPEANHILTVDELLAPEISFFVARESGEAVGTAACRRMAGEPATGGRPYGEIKRMYVDPSRRGRRLGAQLLDAAEARLRRDGYRLALLETGRDQTEALKRYASAGYAPCAPFGGYPDNGLSLFLGKAL
ncbi:MAG: GNAT family N-acetyltransferase [Rubrivivax sp.]|jgi:putative acetyltransferase|nr:GNAT family N-acetyltransferase [Rubrivivax sp.]